MKNFCVVLIVMVFVCGLQAQDRPLLKANIPFSFMLENVSFPAGSYRVSLVDPFNIVELQSLDGGGSAFARGLPKHKGSDGKTELVFLHIDDQFFLTEIHESDRDTQRALPLGKLARELEARHRGGPGVQSVVAVSAH